MMEALGGTDEESTEDRLMFKRASQARTVDPDGDLCLCIENSTSSSHFYYRVSSNRLRRTSRYFENLLDPGRFREGIALAGSLNTSARRTISGSDHTQFLSGHGPSEATVLPILRIKDVDTLTGPSSSEVLFCFLKCAHGQADGEWLVRQSFRFIVSLACVADRFLSHKCLDAAMQMVHRSREHGLKSKTTLLREGISIEQEATWRQHILVGLWYNFLDWVQHYSRLIIIYGSHNWAETTRDPTENLAAAFHPLWNELPEGIEDELLTRRNFILETIASLQDDLIAPYLSGDRRCRLGYDTSPQCDMFQLGQSLRFLHRKQLVLVHSTVAGVDAKREMTGSILALCATLRAFPGYQVDQHHKHCGPRLLLLPRMEQLEALISSAKSIGLCIDCWRGPRLSSHSWAACLVDNWDYGEACRCNWWKYDPTDTHSAHHPKRIRIFTAQHRRWLSDEGGQ